jgi:hypothetical protein
MMWLAGFAAVAHASPAGWQAGTAKAPITPQEPIWMAGYGSRQEPMQGVRQEIYVKALALRDESGTTAVVITADMLGFTADVSDAVYRKCDSKFGLSRDRLVFGASHTHSGPVVGRMLWPAYPLGKPEEEAIDRYTARFIDTTVDVIGRSIQDLAPASLAFEQGLAGFAVNRRRVAHREYPGPVDQDVPVLSVRAADGRLRAVLFGYACHNTSLSDYLINGDWAGFAQHALEAAYPDATALFMAGSGGDANPLPRYGGNDPTLKHYSVELSTMYGKILAAAVDLVLHGKMRPITGPLSTIFETVDLPFHKVPTRAELEARLEDRNPSIQRHAQFLLAKIERDGKLPDRYPYPVQVWQFGRAMRMIVLAGEVVVDYSLRLKSQYGWDDTWVAAYANDVSAYIPSRRVLIEGGYEGGGAMIPYGQPGAFGAAVEEIIIEKIADLVERVGPAREK